MGEAVVFSNKDLAQNFRFVMKQDGAMMAKGLASRFTVCWFIL